ncbi:alanine--tRNA ligase [Caldisericum exile]|uniref:Alanine--tRNA ligase n=1 Tax=Caldisericum exile (strain DSM 21853 / NBRC 104410 / AZM16c01) TaxID=511051 RepID=A0A7U6GDU7_CALEA|nr:alanine--tRNA ligase [Caldisericum exile]BAL80597.1 alanyl-tRNA synthetase [Caldisericum exile AZM16c01]
MNSKEIREGFLKYFETKGHLRLKSFSLVPQDPTLLFTAAGMVPLKSYFLGEEIPPSRRITTVQKCVRTNDIENVGNTPRHHTFFEMLGNFSIGDYFKEEAIAFAMEFILDFLKLPKERLWVTIYKDDLETKEIWKKHGIPEERIIPLGEEDNFWMMGPVGPCGPCSEIYYDRGAINEKEEHELPGSSERRFLEFWSLVFTQYDRQIDGTLKPLPRKNIDTGMGLERITSIIEGVDSDFETDLFMPIIEHIEKLSGVSYKNSDRSIRAMRAIADHARAVTFLIADHVIPSNEKRGYVLRRLIRRAMLFGRSINLTEPFLYKLSETVSNLMGDIYPEVKEDLSYIQSVLKEEETKFNTTLKDGLYYLDNVIEDYKKKGEKEIPGDVVFYLYDTLGVPVEITELALKEVGFTYNKERFEELLESQREKARASFKGSEAFLERVSFGAVKNAVGSVEFVGYETLETVATLKSIIVDGNIVNSATDTDGILVFDKTPFYAEKGGQVGDTGIIKGENFEFEVYDTQAPVEGLTVHIGKLNGSTKVGDIASLSVDALRRQAIKRAHTSTHILQAVLRKHFGENIMQQGSEVKDDEFRFDFNFQGTFEPEELFRIEKEINEIVLKNKKVNVHVMPFNKAKEFGALAFFEEKYGDVVRVIEVEGVSKELCGGTHVSNTGEIGLVVLMQPKTVASGIKRIEGLTGLKAYDFLTNKRKLITVLENSLKTQEDKLVSKSEEIQSKVKELEKELANLKSKLLEGVIRNLEETLKFKGTPIYVYDFKEGTLNDLRKAYDLSKKYLKEGSVIFTSKFNGTSFILVGSLDDKLSSLEILEMIKEVVSLKGGGNERIAQGSFDGIIEIEKVINILGG